MTDLANNLKTGNGANQWPEDSPIWPLEETEFGQDMRRRANRLPSTQHRLSLANFLRGMYVAAGDWNDFLWNSLRGRQPVVGMPDLVHTPGQEDYRPAPLGPGHILWAGGIPVPARGVPAGD